MPLPENLGYIVLDDGDLDAARFWLRVFNLEAYVAAATADIHSRPEVKKASVPIISEHRAGGLYFYYVILLYIDSLGLSGGVGLITFADEKNRALAEEKRDGLAKRIIASIKEQVAKGEMTGETLTIDPTKE
jgi:hypothetical protein